MAIFYIAKCPTSNVNFGKGGKKCLKLREGKANGGSG